MKFLLDQSISPQVGEGLQAAGHDVVHTEEIGMRSARDADILERARTDGRVIVCADTDFGTLLAQQGTNTPSVILFRGETQRWPGRQVVLILANIAGIADALESGCIAVLRDERLRVRALPILPHESP